MLEELSKVALIGTSRGNWSMPSSADASLQQALAMVGSGSAEAQLLAAAGIAGAYERCGRAGGTHAKAVVPSPADQMPECSVRAGELLNQILSMSNTPAKHKLLLEWLVAARRAARRVPHWHLAPLLDYAAGNRGIREAVVLVIDQRGLWLMALNPKWQFAAAEDADAASVFATGNRDQRLAAVRRLRQTDPKAARELIGSTWKEDAADDRAAFVGAMRASLSADDEPFLESALDDRSRQVRAAAAELLSRIEGSAYVRRMLARVEPLLTFTPGVAGGLLKRARPPRVEAQLPPDAFDPTWARDAIVEKPTDRTGRRQWWLAQMLRAVPPTHWSKKWSLTPDECFQAAHGDFADLLITAWSDAAELHHDPAWMRSAVLRSVDDPKQFRAAMLRDLPAEDQREVLAKLFASTRINAQALHDALSDLSTPFDPQVSEAAIAAVERVRDKTSTGYDYTLPGLLDPLSHSLWPGLHDTLAARWTGDQWEANRKSLESFFQTLQIRRDIQTEFRP